MMFRRYICSLLMVLGIGLTANAQTYGNEWINYTKSYYKIKVAKTGLYRIPYQVLSSAPGLPISAISGNNFNLYHKGEVVPYYVTTNGVLGSSDYIEFYGVANDGELDAELYDNPQDQTNPYYSIINDTAVYYLTWNTADANRLITNVTNDLTNLPTKEPYCTATWHTNYNSTYQQGDYSLLGGYPLFESKYQQGEGYSDIEFNLASKSYTIPTANYYGSSGINCTLKVGVISTSQTSHRMRVNFNSLAALKDTTFFGYKLNKWEFSFASNALQTSNTVTFAALGTSNSDRNAVSYIELTYPNAFDFQGLSKFHFSISDAPQTKYIEVSNFSASGTAPILYDLSNNIRIVGQAGVNPIRYKLPAGAGSAERRLFMTSQTSSDIISVSSIELVNFINYNNPANQGDYIILSHSSLANDGAGNNYLNEYAQYRAGVTGGSYDPIVVYIDQLYDQFSEGVKKHPAAIKKFIEFATDRWTVDPQFLFMIGKGREYANTANGQNMRFAASPYAQCKIPTFGFPGADNLLAAPAGSMVPQIPIGRLSAETPNDILIYMNKVMEFEEEQARVGDPYQTIANKLWMKEFMHLGGGNNQSEQTTFKYYLDSYELMVENDTTYGGNVLSFFKNSSNPIQIVQSNSLTDRINNGASLITFFGHASTNSFDFSVDDPANFQNTGKYHMVLSNGCYSGNIFNPTTGVSESFIFAEDRGAVAFFATTALSSSVGLNNYSRNFYENFLTHQYNLPVGEAMKQTIVDMENCCNSDFNRMVAQNMLCHGDPALYMNTHDKPDYDLEPQLVFFDPPVVTVEEDSFSLQVVVTNLGKAIDDSIDLEVIRSLPDGTSFTYLKTVPATHYQDTFDITIATGSTEAFGLNNLQITIDAGDKVANELSETNNTLGLVLNILSEDVFPIYPYEFAIVPDQDITLKASTANAFAGSRDYIMQIDTTELFNSPLLRTHNVTQTGGVLSWNPGVTYQDSVVYYWRVGIDSAGTGTTSKWRYSSFIYLDGSYPGWNQSHYYQWLKDVYQNIYMDTDRDFKFVDDAKDIAVKTGTWDGGGGSLPFEILGWTLNGGNQQVWNCGGSGGFPGGITIAVIDPATGIPWASRVSLQTTDALSGYQINNRYKNIHCKSYDTYGFMFNVGTSYWQDRISAFLDSIPNGHYVLAYSVNNANYSSWNSNITSKFANMGSTALPTLQNQSGYSPWVFFGKKGDPSFAEEVNGNSITDVLDFNTSITAQWYQGTIESPAIGPAYEWGSVHWRYNSIGPAANDSASIDVIGIDRNGLETVLISDLTNLDQALTQINATQYPYLKLRLDTRDDPTRTPVQLDYWRILYEKVPEAALNAFGFFEFESDTVFLGQNMKLAVQIENVTELDMDSLLVKYSIVSSSRSVVVDYVRYDSLRAFETMNIDYTFNTNCGCLSDINSLVIEVNPDDDQPEQFHFNNIGILQFNLASDNANPLLDVTFDQVHIVNGDIVSAEPEILIKLKDENQYLALDDTSLVNIFLKYPDGSLERIVYNDPNVQFIPVVPSQVSKNNTAQVIINKRFEEDGTYELLVQAQDKSNNLSGNYGNTANGIDYRIAFEVVNRAAITNVLNYPNPFTSSTRFVFTLTGSEVPTFFKIQILTISGKVVREIMLDELGPIHIGRNITEFAWDGTDQYGDPLGNGLYMYRVVARLNGDKLEHLETGADKYFKSGLGKMYLAR